MRTPIAAAVSVSTFIMGWSRVRRSLELLVVGFVLFLAVMGVGALLAPDLFLETAEAAAFLSEERAQERERSRRLGAELEAWRRQQLDRVEQTREALELARGAFSGGISSLALDAAGRLVIGGSEAPGLWLGVLRFELDGSVDESFLKNVSRAFERDLVVGNVMQVLPLRDGRILLQGGFRKPETFNRRPKDPGSIAFVLLDDAGRVDEAWLEATWSYGLDTMFADRAIVGVGDVVSFATPSGFRSLTVGSNPSLSAPVAIAKHRAGALCAIAPDRIVGWLDGRLQLIRRDGALIRDLTPRPPDDSHIRGDPPPSISCVDGGRVLAVLPIIRQELQASPLCTERDEPEACRRLCGVEGPPEWIDAGTLVLVLAPGEIVTEAFWPRALRAELATFSKRLDRWIVLSSVDGEPHRRLFTISEQTPSVGAGPTLDLATVSAMIELPDGDLVVAGQRATASAERAQRLYRIAAPGMAIVPF